MIPLHIPIVVHIICSSYRCDNMNYIQDLLRTNIGPRINHNDYISCSKTNKELIECDVHSPYRESCKVCKHLQETFTSTILSDIIGTSVESIEINCNIYLPFKYNNC